MNRISLAGFVAIGMLASVLGGCTAARMRVPGELADEPVVLSVKRDTGMFGKGTVRFGDHRVFKYRRGWTGETSFGVGNVSYHRVHQPFEFRVAASQRQAREVRCATAESFIQIRNDGTVLGRPASSELEIPAEARRFTCELGGSSGDVAGMLQLSQRELQTLSNPTGNLAGSVSLAGANLEIRSVERLDDGRLVAFAGFELRHGNEAVAAVETINEGRVWLAGGLSPSVEETAIVAISALLLNPEWNSGVF